MRSNSLNQDTSASVRNSPGQLGGPHTSWSDQLGAFKCADDWDPSHKKPIRAEESKGAAFSL